MVYRNDIKATIVDGPSKMDLMVALFYAYDQRRGPFSVTFYLKPENPLDEAIQWNTPIGAKGTPMKAQIIGVTCEDGTGESFNIDGFLDPCGLSKPVYSDNFTGYYSTKDRKGTIEFFHETADDK